MKKNLTENIDRFLNEQVTHEDMKDLEKLAQDLQDCASEAWDMVLYYRRMTGARQVRPGSSLYRVFTNLDNVLSKVSNVSKDAEDISRLAGALRDITKDRG